MRCVMCGNPRLKPGTVEESVKIGVRRFVVEVPTLVCSRCNEDYMDDENLRKLELTVAEALAKEGSRIPEAFRFMRKAIGLRAREVAQLLDVTPETVSRWENGERQPETRAAKLLGAMVLEHCAGRDHLRKYLRSLLLRPANTPADRRLSV